MLLATACGSAPIAAVPPAGAAASAAQTNALVVGTPAADTQAATTQKMGDIQQPKPIQTLRPDAWQSPGQVQQPGSVQSAAAPTSTPAPSQSVADSQSSTSTRQAGEIQQPRPIQTLRPDAWPTPGQIQTPGEIQQLPPYVWPTIGEFQQPGDIQVPGEIQTPGDIQSVSGDLPSSAQCLQAAAIHPLGPFTGPSFQLDVPQTSADCQVPAGLYFQSADGLQPMLVMQTVKVNASGGPATVTVYANCMDINKHGPNPSATYTLGGTLSSTSPLGKVVATLPTVPADQITAAGLQAAVWSITNDVTRDHVARVLKFDDGDLASARLVLETAGVSTADKALFK
jgi:hypothetical protein